MLSKIVATPTPKVIEHAYTYLSQNMSAQTQRAFNVSDGWPMTSKV